MGNLFISTHPLIAHKMTMLRDKNTGTKDFRTLISEVSTLLCYEATREVKLIDTYVDTPLTNTKSQIIETKFAIVPILRAGLGMVDGILNLIPTAKVGHIGLYRDHRTLEPVEYYCKLPSDISQRKVFLIDPMLATGGTAEIAIKFLKDKGVKDITLLCILSAPEGVKRVQRSHSDINIYTAAYDDNPLNDNGYIIPGLGDAGDRIFGTK